MLLHGRGAVSVCCVIIILGTVASAQNTAISDSEKSIGFNLIAEQGDLLKDCVTKAEATCPKSLCSFSNGVCLPKFVTEPMRKYLKMGEANFKTCIQRASATDCTGSCGICKEACVLNTGADGTAIDLAKVCTARDVLASIVSDFATNKQKYADCGKATPCSTDSKCKDVLGTGVCISSTLDTSLDTGFVRTFQLTDKATSYLNCLIGEGDCVDCGDSIKLPNVSGKDLTKCNSLNTPTPDTTNTPTPDTTTTSYSVKVAVAWSGSLGFVVACTLMTVVSV